MNQFALCFSNTTAEGSTLDELSDALSRKADERGATSFKILSTTGDNRLHGVAEIYK
ncbi:TPA: DUF1471 domain-containing protein [Salmonella enterica subsp. enterica serovar Chester]|nr:DUF1471 domain-containing protein [Salmonella enterica]MDK8937323.1 DUF1471 domain-containing protein [Salmonella enterica subsp. enterica serovar Sandiego]WGM94863.1 DUF1471 domain-containing protein [Salmonella enterica]